MNKVVMTSMMNHTALGRQRLPARLACLGRTALSGALPALCGLAGLSFVAEEAHAQSFSLDSFAPQTLISPQIPAGFDRGGNTSLDSRPHPDYDAPGFNFGDLAIYPTIETYVGGSSNVLLAQHNPKPDMLVGAQATVYASGDWGPTNLKIYATNWENVWVNTPIRSQDQGFVDAVVGFELSEHVKVDAEGSFIRYGDNNVIGMVNNLPDILEITQKSFGGVRAQYQSGQFSEIVSIDRTHFSLDPIYSPETGFVPSFTGDHTVVRLTSQTEYALTPSFALATELSVYKTDYVSPLAVGVPNYNSTSYRALTGVSLDVPGMIRGQISVGYAERQYGYAAYQTNKSVVIASKFDLFVDQLSQVTLILMKDFDDGTLLAFSPSKYTLGSAAYEHEIRENILGSIEGNYAKYTPLNASTGFSTYGARLRMKYSANHHLSIRTEVGLEHQDIVYSQQNPPNTEVRGKVSFAWSF